MHRQNFVSVICSRKIIKQFSRPLNTEEIFERFDLLSGFNGQEGIRLSASRRRYKVKRALTPLCQMMTPFSLDLCIEFLTDIYGFNNISSLQQKDFQLSEVFGEYR